MLPQREREAQLLAAKPSITLSTCTCCTSCAPPAARASQACRSVLPAGDGGEGVGTSQPAEPRPFLSREDLITYTIAIAASYLFRACAPPLSRSRPTSWSFARGCGSLPCSLSQLCSSQRCAPHASCIKLLLNRF